MYDINKDLPNHICRSCGNLEFYDWYYCNLGKHNTKTGVGVLNMRPLKHCDNYKKRQCCNIESCKEQECIFWCSDCLTYKNK